VPTPAARRLAPVAFHGAAADHYLAFGIRTAERDYVVAVVGVYG
jgi:hypothetical protein